MTSLMNSAGQNSNGNYRSAIHNLRPDRDPPHDENSTTRQDYNTTHRAKATSPATSRCFVSGN